MKKIFQTLLLCCLFFLILEIGSRAMLSVKSVNSAIMKSNCDPIWRWKWIKRHNNGMQIFYRFDMYDATKGWRLIPNLSNMPCFKNKVINSNSRGIRGGIEYPYAKNKNKLRILFIGDSFTFGDEVSDHETYPYYLQQMLPDVEVINMGVHGYGHDQILIYLKEEAVKYNPDIIILGFMSMDSDRNMLEFRDYAKPKFKLVNNKLTVCNIPVYPPEITLKRELWRSKFLDLLNILTHDISVMNGSYTKEKEAITNAILKEIVVTANDIGAVPVFVYLSNVRSKKPDPMTKEERGFLKRCENLSVKCAFLRHEISTARLSGLKIKERGHFDPRTNRLVALGIKDYLLKNGLLNKSSSQ